MVSNALSSIIMFTEAVSLIGLVCTGICLIVSYAGEFIEKYIEW